MKKAQLGAFIIIGLILLSSVILFFYYKNSNKSEQVAAQNPPQQNSEQYFRFLDECINDQVQSIVLDFFKNGAYTSQPEESREILFLKHPYYLKDSKSFVPSKEKIESEFGTLAKRQIKQCINQLQSSYPPLKISSGNPEIKTNLGEDSIDLNINYPVTIDSQTKDRFMVKLPLKALNDYNAINYFISQQKSTDGLCWSCLHDTQKRFNINISNQVIDDNTVLFSFEDSGIEWIFLGGY